MRKQAWHVTPQYSHTSKALEPSGLSTRCVPLWPSRSVCPQIPGTHLEQALPLAQAASLQAPEVDVGFATGYQQAGISGVEGSHQHGLIRAL